MTRHLKPLLQPNKKKKTETKKKEKKMLGQILHVFSTRNFLFLLLSSCLLSVQEGNKVWRVVDDKFPFQKREHCDCALVL